MSGEGSASAALAEVERQLSELWAPEPGAPPKTRVSTANLVVLTASARRDATVALLDQMAAPDVARTLLVSLDPRLPFGALKAEVNARCRRDGDGLLCAERVDLALGQGLAGRAASIVAALCVAEVPTVVAALDPVPPELIAAVAKLGDRLVVDSRALGPERVYRLSSELHSRAVDLAWERLEPWRRQLAACFDDEPFRSGLASVERVTATFTSVDEASTPLAPRLMLGWLASRLGWTIASPDHAVAAGGRPVRLELSPDWNSDLPPGSLVSFGLDSASGPAPFAARLRHEGSPPALVVERSAAGRDEPPARSPLRVEPLHDLFDRAIETPAPDETWRQALGIAVRMPTEALSTRGGAL
ncbi:MAG TPA: glucose-6-phosphate dehydrogenase assembly protein OpcA [Polyangiaceae bacterium]|nr:glucose-6-phosphate dehydrogenase assembly protein OpcA [Polyangiaceae bacterium]